jgi:hypothetical protein
MAQGMNEAEKTVRIMEGDKNSVSETRLQNKRWIMKEAM